MSAAYILVVDDEPDIRGLVQEILDVVHMTLHRFVLFVREPGLLADELAWDGELADIVDEG